MTKTQLKTKKRTSAAGVIAATIGWSQSEMADCRYQATRTKQAIYTIGGDYYAASATKPADDVGQPWELFRDQFWGEHYGTKVWVSKMAKGGA